MNEPWRRSHEVGIAPPASSLDRLRRSHEVGIAPPASSLDRRVLVAGIGNVFLGDDGFGVEVAKRMLGEPLPPGVRVADFGIRGVHLAYELLDGWDTAILVDAVPRGGEPGTLYVLEPEPVEPEGNVELGLIDAHDLDPQAVLGLVRTLGGTPGRVLIVGCEPESVDARMSLSERVAKAVDDAVRLVRELVEAELDRTGHEVGKGR